MQGVEGWEARCSPWTEPARRPREACHVRVDSAKSTSAKTTQREQKGHSALLLSEHSVTPLAVALLVPFQRAPEPELRQCSQWILMSDLMNMQPKMSPICRTMTHLTSLAVCYFARSHNFKRPARAEGAGRKGDTYIQILVLWLCSSFSKRNNV